MRGLHFDAHFVRGGCPLSFLCVESELRSPANTGDIIQFNSHVTLHDYNVLQSLRRRLHLCPLVAKLVDRAQHETGGQADSRLECTAFEWVKAIQRAMEVILFIDHPLSIIHCSIYQSAYRDDLLAVSVTDV